MLFLISIGILTRGTSKNAVSTVFTYSTPNESANCSVLESRIEINLK